MTRPGRRRSLRFERLEACTLLAADLFTAPPLVEAGSMDACAEGRELSDEASGIPSCPARLVLSDQVVGDRVAVEINDLAFAAIGREGTTDS